ncbi:MAG: hypothetical protein KBS82_05375 [Oscillospiraceae bacterium]|nr:hypothetical protein [Candidatus Limimonas egerieequi]
MGNKGLQSMDSLPSLAGTHKKVSPTTVVQDNGKPTAPWLECIDDLYEHSSDCAEWLDCGNYLYECSDCGFHVDIFDYGAAPGFGEYELYHYCPYCGAEMSNYDLYQEYEDDDYDM